MRGTWKGSGTWQTSGGPDLSGLIPAAAAVAVAVAVAEVVIEYIWWIVGIGSGLAVGVAVGIIWRTRSDRPGAPIAAPPAWQVPPGSGPRLEGSDKPAIGPGRELHIHLHGLTPEQIAAIVTRRDAYLEEDR